MLGLGLKAKIFGLEAHGLGLATQGLGLTVPALSLGLLPCGLVNVSGSRPDHYGRNRYHMKPLKQPSINSSLSALFVRI